ncbi:MAG: NAD(P)-dependent oxidoreductase [Thermaerobacterales bacterium]
MRVLVTGGTGSVGINIVRHLAAKGHEVLCVSRKADSPDPARDQFLAPVSERVTVVGGDVGDHQSTDALFETYRPTHVVHAAAITPTPEMERSMGRVILNANLMGTVHILEAAQRFDCKRVVFISSAAVYGDVSEDVVIGDDHPTQPNGLYGIAKDASERLCAYYESMHGLESVITRVGWVYGPMERQMEGSRYSTSLVHQFVAMGLAGEEIRLVHLDHLRDWIHADDLGAAILALLQEPRLEHRIYNLSGGRGYSHQELLTTLQDILPVTYRHVSNPAEANIPTAATRARRGPTSIARLTADTGFTQNFDLRDGLSDYVRWVRSTSNS